MTTYQDARADTERFNRFLWHENKRLNRLIRNLYLEFQLKHYTERELYDRICQEVADYFHAAGCQLYLVCYEEFVIPPEENLINPNYPIPQIRLRKWLELVGAAGPWKRALRQQYVRTKSRSRYELSFREDYRPPKDSSSTRQDFLAETAIKYDCTFAIPGQLSQSHRGKELDGDGIELQEDVPHQVVWRNDCLYNTCRCVLAAPLIRDAVPPEAEPQASLEAEQQVPTKSSAEKQPSTASHYRIGLIKIENRMPHGVCGFAEVPLHGDFSSDLLFDKEWQLAALRPYLRDLQKRCQKGNVSVYEPLVNDVGWQQYFEDNPVGMKSYEDLLVALRAWRKSHQKSDANNEIRNKYSELSSWLRDLTECLARLEAYLQQLRHACYVLCGLCEPATVDHPVPSFFNVLNFRSAYLIELEQNPLEVLYCIDLAPNGNRGRLYSRAFNAFLGQLTDSSQKAESVRQKASLVLASEAVVRLFSRARTWDDKSSSQCKAFYTKFVNKLRAAIRQPDQPYAKDARSLLDLLEEPDMANSPGIADRQAMVASATAFRISVGQSLEIHVKECLEHKVNFLRKVLGSAGRPFNASECFENPVPKWNFTGATAKILVDLHNIAKQIANADSLTNGNKQSIRQYELLAEEQEMHRVGRRVLDEHKEQTTKGTLRASHNLEKTVQSVAAVLGEATMFADAFRQVDKDRLMFIASHVAQILDNHLLFQARQRGLELDHASLSTFGLDAPGVELLDTLQFLVERISCVLEFIARRRAMKTLGKDFAWTRQILLNSFRDAMRAAIEGHPRDHRSPFWEDRCMHDCKSDLALLRLEVNPAVMLPGGDLLEAIRRLSQYHGIDVSKEQTVNPDHCGCLLFHNNGRLVVPSDRSANCRLTVWSKSGRSAQEKGATLCELAQGEVVELRIAIPCEGVKSRDLRSLWSGVKILEDVLEILEAVARG